MLSFSYSSFPTFGFDIAVGFIVWCSILFFRGSLKFSFTACLPPSVPAPWIIRLSCYATWQLAMPFSFVYHKKKLTFSSFLKNFWIQLDTHCTAVIRGRCENKKIETWNCPSSKVAVTNSQTEVKRLWWLSLCCSLNLLLSTARIASVFPSAKIAPFFTAYRQKTGWQGKELGERGGKVGL